MIKLESLLLKLYFSLILFYFHSYTAGAQLSDVSNYQCDEAAWHESFGVSGKSFALQFNVIAFFLGPLKWQL